ncbi:hypothetical protein [Fangia hongkongensis]|uniref:hypothetical protein n=1 Tax=Fangia hongkongensis TaxID=270495 RepID=UPI00038180D7|nr:hypothetical protein [Fangia hongkongensis]MBK2126357.1 hypothetical protein [Fangia hongkongensis]
MLRPKRVYAAIWMLYAVSILGLLDMLTSYTLMMIQPHFVWVDAIAYIILIVVAFWISLGSSFAKYLYIVLAVIWYFLLVFVLSHIPGHPLNFGLAFIEMVLIVAAMIILHQRKASRWFKGDVKAVKP